MKRFMPSIPAFASLYQQKLAALDALKKSLLYRAFSGQLSATVDQT